MSDNTGRILKRNKVSLTGQRRLSPSVRTPPPGAAPLGNPQGRIVEQDDFGAIVEVTCGCGQVFHLHCTYAGQAAAQ